MNWKGNERKVMNDLAYYPSICLEEHRQPTKACQESQSLGRDLRLTHPKYKANYQNSKIVWHILPVLDNNNVTNNYTPTVTK
jgi:hypothetical protein